MVSIWFLGGLTIFCVGVIGIYLAKVFTETKRRPYTVVRRVRTRERHDVVSDAASSTGCGSTTGTRCASTADAARGRLELRRIAGAPVRELSRLWDGDTAATLVDYGCGYGALARYLRTIATRGSIPATM